MKKKRVLLGKSGLPVDATTTCSSKKDCQVGSDSSSFVDCGLNKRVAVFCRPFFRT